MAKEKKKSEEPKKLKSERIRVSIGRQHRDCFSLKEAGEYLIKLGGVGMVDVHVRKVKV